MKGHAAALSASFALALLVATPGTSFNDVPFTYDVTFSAPVAPRVKK
jgi:hypothetical protein